jgi:hypothetical protein
MVTRLAVASRDTPPSTARCTTCRKWCSAALRRYLLRCGPAIAIVLTHAYAVWLYAPVCIRPRDVGPCMQQTISLAEFCQLMISRAKNNHECGKCDGNIRRTASMPVTLTELQGVEESVEVGAAAAAGPKGSINGPPAHLRLELPGEDEGGDDENTDDEDEDEIPEDIAMLPPSQQQVGSPRRESYAVATCATAVRCRRWHPPSCARMSLPESPLSLRLPCARPHHCSHTVPLSALSLTHTGARRRRFSSGHAGKWVWGLCWC